MIQYFTLHASRKSYYSPRCNFEGIKTWKLVALHNIENIVVVGRLVLLAGHTVWCKVPLVF